MKEKTITKHSNSKSHKNLNSHQRANTLESEARSTLYCKYKNLYLNPQLLAKSKNIINYSSALQMWSFAKDPRFKPTKRRWDAMYYEIPTTKTMRTTTFGFGGKTDIFKNTFKHKTHAIYDIPREFELARHNSPQITMGYGREVCKKPELTIPKVTPGVGSYELRMPPGKDALKFSLFGRTWANQRSKSFKQLRPCPGTYENILSINPKGKYVNSLFDNTKNVTFKGPERFKVRRNENPPPGAYEYLSMFNKTGFHFASRFDSKIGKTMSNRPNEFYQKNKMSSTPGPGSYNLFSEFDGYMTLKKKCRCGRDLGHPMIYSPCGSKCNSNNISKYSQSSLKKFVNLTDNNIKKRNAKLRPDESGDLKSANYTATNFKTLASEGDTNNNTNTINTVN